MAINMLCRSKFYKMESVSMAAVLLHLPENKYILSHPEDGRHHGEIFLDIDDKLRKGGGILLDYNTTFARLETLAYFHDYIPHKRYRYGDKFKVGANRYYAGALDDLGTCVINFDTFRVLFNCQPPDWDLDLTPYLK